MPDPQGWTVQWGGDVRVSLPFIASGGVGGGVYVTGFTAQDELGFYVDLSGNKYETSNGTETFGGDIGFVGRSLALGVRAAQTFDFVIGGQQQGATFTAEFSAHLWAAGVKIIVPINNSSGTWSGYGVGFTIGPGLYAGADLVVSGNAPILQENPDGSLDFASSGGLQFSFVNRDPQNSAPAQFVFGNNEGTATAIFQIADASSRSPHQNRET